MYIPPRVLVWALRAEILSHVLLFALTAEVSARLNVQLDKDLKPESPHASVSVKGTGLWFSGECRLQEPRPRSTSLGR